MVTGRTLGPAMRTAALLRLGLSMDPDALQSATELPFSLNGQYRSALPPAKWTWQKTFDELAGSSERPSLPHQPSTHRYPVVTVGLWSSAVLLGGKRTHPPLASHVLSQLLDMSGHLVIPY